MNPTFSHALRVLVCRACGAAVHVGVDGGSAPCEVCAAPLDVGPRVEAPPLPSRVSDEERHRRLVRQVGLRRLDPAVEAWTDADGVVTDAAAGAAFETWQSLRDDGEPPFFDLTVALVERLARQGDLLQLRALLETAIEAIGDPPRRHELTGRLARAAALADDPAAATEWLASCDPAAIDLHAHTAYLLASVIVATKLRSPEDVLELVGPSAESAVVARWADGEVSVLRAHALEARDGVDAGSFELADAIGRLGGAAVDRAFESLERLRPCVRSRGAAEVLSAGSPRLETAEIRSPNRWRSLAPWAALSVACLLVALAMGPDVRVAGDHRLDVAFLVLAFSAGLPLIIAALRARGRREAP